MIAVDTNILVYAHREESPWFAAAERAIDTIAAGAGGWAVPWPCLHEFLSTVTNPRVFRTPTPIAAAVEQVEAWLESPSLVILREEEGYWPTLRTLILQARLSGPRIHDARIAALCLTHAVRELWTADRDFLVFPALRTRNPLIGDR